MLATAPGKILRNTSGNVSSLGLNPGHQVFLGENPLFAYLIGRHSLLHQVVDCLLADAQKLLSLGKRYEDLLYFFFGLLDFLSSHCSTPFIERMLQCDVALGTTSMY